MRTVTGIKDTEEERARARLIAYFENNPNSVFLNDHVVPYESDEVTRLIVDTVTTGRSRLSPT
jgi:ethanolamine ammonia-lyase large subunit